MAKKNGGRVCRVDAKIAALGLGDVARARVEADFTIEKMARRFLAALD